MARRRSKAGGTTTSLKGSGRSTSGGWPQIRGGRNMGRGVNGGSRRQGASKRGEASSAFPVNEWPYPR